MLYELLEGVWEPWEVPGSVQASRPPSDTTAPEFVIDARACQDDGVQGSLWRLPGRFRLSSPAPAPLLARTRPPRNATNQNKPITENVGQPGGTNPCRAQAQEFPGTPSRSQSPRNTLKNPVLSARARLTSQNSPPDRKRPENDAHFREFPDPAPKLGIGQFARFRITL